MTDTTGGDETLTVSELARRIRRALERELPEEVWVEGELANLDQRRGRHRWFSLVEPPEPGARAARPEASIAVVLFDSDRQRVNQLLRRHGAPRMVDGLHVRVRGLVELYAPGGQLQLRMTGIDPLFTIGRLAAERERVIAALRAAGLLERNRQLPMPVVPLKLGLVTAAASAAYADFIHELERSGLGFSVVHTEARMQGRDAERTVAAALSELARREVDVTAVVRGGGDRIDLACFDSEGIARAIAEHPVPVHTGIGHETDTSVADLVAHSAHKTPTACAAALVARVQEYLDALSERWSRVAATSEGSLDAAASYLELAAREVPRAARSSLAAATAAVDHASGALRREAMRRLDSEGRGIAARERELRALDPRRVLERGWSITRSADGTVVRSAADLAEGAVILTTLRDGEARSIVERVTQTARAREAATQRRDGSQG